jgi:DNA repair ATPase RecN
VKEVMEQTMNEVMEQARLLGMSAERELALRAKLEASEARLKACEANCERLRELADEWATDARDASDRADSAEARVQELEAQASSFQAAMAELVRRHGETHDRLCAVLDAARQHGGAK